MSNLERHSIRDKAFVIIRSICGQRIRFLLMWCLLSVLCRSAPASELSGDLWLEHGLSIARQNIETPMLGAPATEHVDADVSRDGRFVVYSERQADVSANQNHLVLWLAGMDSRYALKSRVQLEQITSPSMFSEFRPQFSSDGLSLAYLSANRPGSDHELTVTALGTSIAVRRLNSGQTSIVQLNSIPTGLFGPGFEPKSFDVFQLRPDGQQLAVVIIGLIITPILAGVEVSDDDSPWYAGLPQTSRRLAIYELASGKWQSVTPSDTDVRSFDWAPDGQRIAYSGVADGGHGYKAAMATAYTDLFLIEVENGRTQKIVTQPGTDTAPRWSPDGKWIAFKSQAGIVRWLGGTRVGLYNVLNGITSYPAYERLGEIAGEGSRVLRWAPRSNALLVLVDFHLSKQLFSISIPDGQLRQITNDVEANYCPVQYVLDKGAFVFSRQSLLEPSELFVSPPGRFQPAQLTAHQTGLTPLNVQVRQVSWPSTDGKWTVHGWLLDARGAGKPSPGPLLVYAEGGPDMVDAAFLNGGHHYPLRAFLAGGVSVLIPNSRGRGGYGADFQNAWETEHDFGRGPLEDDLAGVDMLIKDGIAAPNRVGLAGHSWGGYLAAYALTHTQRFQTILIDEGVNLDPLELAMPFGNNSAALDFGAQTGTGNPFDPKEQDHLRALSPIYQVSNASTPSLLEFGAQGGGIKEAFSLFGGLRHFNRAPTELIVYPRSSHITEEPALRFDAARRDLEWFAYWILGKPTERMLDRYGPSKISEWNPDTGGQPLAPNDQIPGRPCRAVCWTGSR